MKKTYLIIILTFLQSYSLMVLSQDLQFYREDIVFKVNKNAIITDAVYHFCNVGEKEVKTQLFYPLPANTMEQIDTLVIWDVGANEVIPYRKGRSGVFFPVSADAYGQAAYRVYFQQWLNDQQFTYILTSTENWRRALDFANFELQAPAYLTIDSLSYPPDTSFVEDDTQYFFWKKTDFMPEKDFEVSFK